MDRGRAWTGVCHGHGKGMDRGRSYAFGGVSEASTGIPTRSQGSTMNDTAQIRLRGSDPFKSDKGDHADHMVAHHMLYMYIH
jgi:hypothetical protein